MTSVAELCAAISQMPAESLRAAANAGEWPLHRLRVELDTAARLTIAREAIAEFDRPHALELWREPGARSRGVSREEIAERRLQALARAWARLGGGEVRSGEFLFHLRGEVQPREERPLTRTDVDAPRIAINPNPRVAEAPYLMHPISLAEVARFAIVLPVMRCCVPLGEAVASAFDTLGQPTAALHLRAQQQIELPVRDSVWRIRSAARRRRACVRMLNYAVLHLLCDCGAADEPEQLGVAALTRHYEHWTQLEATIIGVLAWRRACERDGVVQPSRYRGHTLALDPAVLGRRYRELDDPFTPLLAILWLGCRLHEFSREAVTLVIEPQPVA